MTPIYQKETTSTALIIRDLSISLKLVMWGQQNWFVHSTKQIIKILGSQGIQVDDEEATVILDFLYLMAKNHKEIEEDENTRTLTGIRTYFMDDLTKLMELDDIIQISK